MLSPFDVCLAMMSACSWDHARIHDELEVSEAVDIVRGQCFSGAVIESLRVPP